MLSNWDFQDKNIHLFLPCGPIQDLHFQKTTEHLKVERTTKFSDEISDMSDDS
jgi:hypothetical protein